MILSINSLKKVKEINPFDNIVYCSGVFDLLHLGHIKFFENCRKYGGILVVGVGSDKSSTDYKRKPILNEQVRLKMVNSISGVKYSFILSEKNSGDISMNGVKEALELLKPHVWVINDDAKNIRLRKKISKDLGIKLIILERDGPKEFKNISTGKIIEEVVKRYG